MKRASLLRSEESKTNYLVPHPFFTSAYLSTTIVDHKFWCPEMKNSRTALCSFLSGLGGEGCLFINEPQDDHSSTMTVPAFQMHPPQLTHTHTQNSHSMHLHACTHTQTHTIVHTVKSNLYEQIEAHLFTRGCV